VARLGWCGRSGRSRQPGPMCQREDREKASWRKAPLSGECVFPKNAPKALRPVGPGEMRHAAGRVARHGWSWAGQAEFPGMIEMEKIIFEF
jgi:hypothetical protein